MIQIDRPGVEINIQSAPNTYSAKDGIVALVLPLEMGPAGTDYVELHQTDDLHTTFTLNGLVNAEYLPLIQYMLQFCQTIKVYPVESSEQATVVVDSNVTLYANHVGDYGNALKVEIVKDKVNSTYFVVNVYFRDKLLESFSKLKRWEEVADLTDLLSVAYKNSSDLLVEGTHNLADGSSPNLTIGDYTSTLSSLQHIDFNVFVTPLGITPTDGDVWETVENATDKAIQDIRENDEQLKRYIVTSETNKKVSRTNLPFKYVLNATGLYKADGYRFEDYEAKCILGAIIAGTDANVSLTNLAVTGAVNVYNPQSNRNIKSYLQDGYTMFYKDARGIVRIVKDQTAFVEEDGVTPICYTSGLCIREVDFIVDRIKQDFESYWMGIEKGTEASAKLYKDVVYALLDDFQREGYITNVAIDDVTVTLNGRNGFILDLALQPTDALEKLNINVEVR